jgi:uncharacterized protein
VSRKMGLLGFGILFGFTLSRVGASEFDLIFRMFTGEDLTLAWVMITAILVGFLGMRILLGQRQVTRSGEPIKVSRKNLGRFSLWGAALFGFGWGMAGACPGTVLAQLGEGKIFGSFTFAGMVAGTYLYALLKEKTPDL